MKAPFQVSVLLFLIITASGLGAEENSTDPWYERFIGDDGNFDLAATLDKPAGFFPLVTPITEPAVGVGAAFVPIFIDLPKDGKSRPDIWSAGAMRTNNGSEAVFGGYSAYLDDNKWRVFAGGVDGSVNLDFHGLGGNLDVDGDPLRYTIENTGGLIGADRQIGDSDWRIGGRYFYGEVETSPARTRDEPGFLGGLFEQRFGDLQFESVISSVQVALNYDTRDNIFTPTRGVFAELDVTANSELIGASSDYQIAALTGIWYTPLIDDTLFLGVRGDLIQSFGDIPFYRRPAVALRGVPARRYQGAGTGFSEIELRYQFLPRWSAVGFVGGGLVWPGDAPFQQPDALMAGGGGLRYLIAKRHGLHAGFDVAYGEEGTAFYIQFGSGWFRP